MEHPTYGNNITLPTYRENAQELFNESLKIRENESKLQYFDRDKKQALIERASDKCREYMFGRFKTVRDFAESYLKDIKIECKHQNLKLPTVNFTDDMSVSDVEKYLGAIFYEAVHEEPPGWNTNINIPFTRYFYANYP